MSYTFTELKSIAKKFNIPSKGLTKNQLRSRLKKRYIAKEDYVKVGRLGSKGSDGIVYLVKIRSIHLGYNKEEYALKQFKTSKSIDQLIKEIVLQNLASQAGISPKIKDYDLVKKFIIMDKLDDSLLNIYTKQGFNLTLSQQQQLIKIFQTLDQIKVFHADPSPLNFMVKGNKIFIIDFGFAKEINEEVIKKHTHKPNMKFMIFGFILKIHEQYPDVHFSHLERYLS